MRERWIQRGSQGCWGLGNGQACLCWSPRRRGHNRNNVGKITGQKFPYADEKHQTIESKTLKTANRSLYKRRKGASLVAQWLRVCLPVQGTQVRALVWEDPTCRRVAGPVSHNC